MLLILYGLNFFSIFKYFPIHSRTICKFLFNRKVYMWTVKYPSSFHLNVHLHFVQLKGCTVHISYNFAHWKMLMLKVFISHCSYTFQTDEMKQMKHSKRTMDFFHIHRAESMIQNISVWVMYRCVQFSSKINLNYKS